MKTFVVRGFRKQASWHANDFHHYRDRDKAEVDLVPEHGLHGVAGTEVKASSSVDEKELNDLRKLAKAAGKNFAGTLLYDGTPYNTGNKE